MTMLRVQLSNLNQTQTFSIDEAQLEGVRSAMARQGFTKLTVLGQTGPAYSAAGLAGEVLPASRSGAIGYSSMDGRAHVVPSPSDMHPLSPPSSMYGGMDGQSQQLRTENTDGDDAYDQEDDYVEAAYEDDDE